MRDVKYPDVHVQLTGNDGNAFGVIGAVEKAIRREVGRDEAKEFTDTAYKCGSYDELLQLCMKTVDCT